MSPKHKTHFNQITLDSGATVLTERIDQVRSVTLGFWIRVGARDESLKLSGISHFLEHLLFKGTKTRTSKQISETFDSLGGELNALTAKEYTCFYVRLLDKHVPTGVEIISDMLQNSSLKEKDIVSEKQVVLEEINLHEDSPDEKIHDLFATALWGENPLGKSILGQVKSVESFDQRTIRHFYKRYYGSNNIVVAAAGYLEHERIVDLVRRHFTKTGAKKSTRPDLPPPAGNRLLVETKQTEQAHLCYGFPSLHARHKDRFVLALLDTILGGGMSSRLFQKIREEKGLAYSVYSYHSLYSESGLMAIYAGTRPSKVEEVVKLINEEINSIVEKGVTSKELLRAKEHLKGQLILSLESTSKRMIRLGRAKLTGSEILSLDELISRIDKVENQDVQRVAKEIFSRRDGAAIAVIGPFEEEKLAHLVDS